MSNKCFSVPKQSFGQQEKTTRNWNDDNQLVSGWCWFFGVTRGCDAWVWEDENVPCRAVPCRAHLTHV